MTAMNFSVTQNPAVFVEDRRWLWGIAGTQPGDNPGGTLDISTLTAATHYPNGYVKSGLVLGRFTSNANLYGAYTPGATNGTQTAVALLFSSVQIPNLADLTQDAAIALFIRGNVDPNRLPIASGTPGGLDTAARTALNLIHFLANA